MGKKRSVLIGQQVAVHADQEALLSAEVKGSGEASIHIHYTHTVCTYIIIRGGALRSVRIADCYCNRDDLRGETQQRGHASLLVACSQCENNYCRKAYVSMRALPGWHTGVGTWLRWPQDSRMASPRLHGHSARDITNVMQKLQGRCKMLTHSQRSTLVCGVFRGDLVTSMTQQNMMGLELL